MEESVKVSIVDCFWAFMDNFLADLSDRIHREGALATDVILDLEYNPIRSVNESAFLVGVRAEISVVPPSRRQIKAHGYAYIYQLSYQFPNEVRVTYLGRQ